MLAAVLVIFNCARPRRFGALASAEGQAVLVAHRSLASSVPESRSDGGRREAGQIPAAAGARCKRALPSLFAMLQMGFLWLRYLLGALISTGRAPSNLTTLLQQNEFKASSARSEPTHGQT